MFDGTDTLLDEYGAMQESRGLSSIIKKAKEIMWPEEDVEYSGVDELDKPDPVKLFFKVNGGNPKRVFTQWFTAQTWKAWKKHDKDEGCGSIVIPVPDIDGFKLSIPFNAIDRKRLSTPIHSSDPKDIVQALKRPSTIRNWIFTPSYCGKINKSYVTGPDEKLLIRDEAFSVPSGVSGESMYQQLQRWDDYAELLIVRKSQFADYRILYGSTHVIAAMPDQMHEQNEKKTTTFNVKDGGIGYARLFGQRLANYLELPAVWMLDDNILQCWKLLCSELHGVPGAVKPSEPASFAEIMIHIESLFREHPCKQSSYPNMQQQAEHAIQSSGKSSLEEVIGTFDNYGIVGLCRGQQWRDKILHPIKRSYSVYSFFLLNVKETMRQKLYFPCRPIWEDIEFNNLLDENQLMVCKLQVFAHEKPNRSQPPTLSPSDILVQWLLQHYKVPTCNCENIMTRSSLNEVLTIAHDEYLSSLHASPMEGNDCVFFVHNPTVEQFGVLKGIERAITSKELLFDKLLQNLPESGSDCVRHKRGNCLLVLDSSNKSIEAAFKGRKRHREEDIIINLTDTLPEVAAEKYFVAEIGKEELPPPVIVPEIQNVKSPSVKKGEVGTLSEKKDNSRSTTPKLKRRSLVVYSDEEESYGRRSSSSGSSSIYRTSTCDTPSNQQSKKAKVRHSPDVNQS